MNIVPTLVRDSLVTLGLVRQGLLGSGSEAIRQLLDWPDAHILPDGRIDLKGFVDTRSADLMVKDYQGIWRAIPGGTVGVENARVVRNVVLNKDTLIFGNNAYLLGNAVEAGMNTIEVFKASDGVRIHSQWSPPTDVDGFPLLARCVITNLSTESLDLVFRSQNWNGSSVFFTIASGQSMTVGSSGNGVVNITPNLVVQLEADAVAPAKLLISNWQLEVADSPSEYSGNSVDFYATSNATVLDPDGVILDAVGDPLPGPFTMVHEPAGTNLVPWSNDLTQWTHLSSALSYYDQEGIDGNISATRVEDPDDTVWASVQYIHNAVIDYGVCRIYIKKDLDETRFPELQVESYGVGVTKYLWLQLNTHTGELYERRIDSNFTYTLLEDGTWWVICVTVDNISEQNDKTAIRLYPAVSSIPGGSEASATGSVIVGYVEFAEYTTLPDIYLTPPIFTAGAAAASRDITAIEHPQDGAFTEDEGVVYVEILYKDMAQMPLYQTPQVVTVGNLPIYHHRYISDGPAEVSTNDGSNQASATGLEYQPDQVIQMACRYSTKENILAVGYHAGTGVWEWAETTFNGSWGGQGVIDFFRTMNTMQARAKVIQTFNKYMPAEDIETLGPAFTGDYVYQGAGAGGGAAGPFVRYDMGNPLGMKDTIYLEAEVYVQQHVDGIYQGFVCWGDFQGNATVHETGLYLGTDNILGFSISNTGNTKSSFTVGAGTLPTKQWLRVIGDYDGLNVNVRVEDMQGNILQENTVAWADAAVTSSTTYIEIMGTATRSHIGEFVQMRNVKAIINGIVYLDAALNENPDIMAVSINNGVGANGIITGSPHAPPWPYALVDGNGNVLVDSNGNTLET